mmetsp:Transcript_23905/g.43866  ORF Transcript_23905/g.43866 Transcript_23905/m.43866 type:complete len:460 (-) Transcript_23905:154-1533(-)
MPTPPGSPPKVVYRTPRKVQSRALLDGHLPSSGENSAPLAGFARSRTLEPPKGEVVHTGSTYQFVVALDINGTIVEGDTIKGSTKRALALTAPARELLEFLRTAPVRFALFTFGQDWQTALHLVQHHAGARFPWANRFFIARAADNSEIWAFPMPHSRYIDFFSRKNPVIVDGLDIEDVPIIKDATEVKDAAARRWFEDTAFRFQDSSLFKLFVDIVMEAGDVVFRAAYSPACKYFCSRSTSRCKVLMASVPVLAFDDNEQDWEINEQEGRVVHVASPSLCECLNAPHYEDEKWLAKCSREQTFQQVTPGSFRSTDLLGELIKFSRSRRLSLIARRRFCRPHSSEGHLTHHSCDFVSRMPSVPGPASDENEISYAEARHRSNRRSRLKETLAQAPAEHAVTAEPQLQQHELKRAGEHQPTLVRSAGATACMMGFIMIGLAWLLSSWARGLGFDTSARVR